MIHLQVLSYCIWNPLLAYNLGVERIRKKQTVQITLSFFFFFFQCSVWIVRPSDFYCNARFGSFASLAFIAMLCLDRPPVWLLLQCSVRIVRQSDFDCLWKFCFTGKGFALTIIIAFGTFCSTEFSQCKWFHILLILWRQRCN